MNIITILNTRLDKTATKTFQRLADGRIKEFPYRSGALFTHIEHEVNSIDDMFALLCLLEPIVTSMIIRGQVRPQFAGREEVTRTLHDEPISGQVGMFQDFDDGLNWMMGDFDKIDLPPGMTAEMGVEMLIKTLPTEFHEASYCYQLSSSAGIAGVGVRMVEKIDPTTDEKTMMEDEYAYHGWSKLSAHVFFWLKHKNNQIAQWARNLNAVRGIKIIDPAPLHTVQPNYTARPIFVGMVDPVGEQRHGFVRKASDEVDLVWIDAPTKYVMIDGKEHQVGSIVERDGVAMIATPSLEDRFAMIVPGNRRQGLKDAIGYYFWYHGTDATKPKSKAYCIVHFPVASSITWMRDISMLWWAGSPSTHHTTIHRPISRKKTTTHWPLALSNCGTMPRLCPISRRQTILQTGLLTWKIAA